MKLSEIAIKRPITTVMFFSAIVLLGLVSFVRLPMQLLPDFTAPGGGAFCRIMDNMSPEEMERKIIIPIEGEIAQLPNVKNMYTYSWREGAFFRIEFEFGANVKYRIVDLQERLDRFKKTFPKRSIVLDAFPFESSHFNQQFMDLVLKGPRDDIYLQAVNADKIREKLQDIDGVANADIWGGRRRAVDITILQDHLQEFGVPIWQVRNRVQTFANEPVFLGDVEERGKKLYVRLDGQFGDTSEVEDVVVKNDGNIAVRHLGEVEDNYHSRRWLRRVDGKPALGIGLEKEALVNPVELSNRVRNIIREINKDDLPHGYELDIVWDASDEIMAMLKSLSKLAVMGIILSMIILYLFIRNVRMSLMICLVIPLCVVATFNGMYFSNMSINMFTLVGLAVGVGCLIDTSIVVLENVFRHHERGRDAISSALIGTREVDKAVFALTLTNVVVFVPIVFVEGFIRLLFSEAALAIIYPMVISMVVALTLVPMLTSRLMLVADNHRKMREALGCQNRTRRPSFWRKSANFISDKMQPVKKQFSRLPVPTMKTAQKYYGRILKGCLRHRVRFLIAIIVLILYTYYYTMGGMNQDVLDEPEDQDSFYVYVYLPNGTKQDHTLKVIDQVEDLLLAQVPEAEHIHSWIRDDSANVRVMLKKLEDRDRESETIRESLRPYLEGFKAAEVTFEETRTRGEQQTPPVDSGRGGTIEIRGPEYNQINELSQNFAAIVNQISGIRDVYSDNEPGPWEVHFTLDRDAAALLQVTPQLIAQSIQLAQRRGDYASIIMKKGDDEIDIIFSLVEKSEDMKKSLEEIGGMKFEELKQIPIYSPSMGSTVPLADLGAFSLKRGQSSMQRENRERIGHIRFETAPNTNFADIENSVRELIDVYPAPAGYQISLGGRSQRINEFILTVEQIIWIALILIYMCMASLFESFSLPLVIFLSIPLSLMGIVWFFILTNTQFTEMAGMGAIFLIGILPNSAILLMHFCGYLRKVKKHTRERAVMVAGSYRLRPIFMTVATTILGLVPMAIAWKGQSNEWVPFSRCVIGGLASSTILTLIIVPGFYFIVEDVTNIFKRCLHYVMSWRWIFIFWSRQKRLEWKMAMTSYRQKPVREEPLVVQLDHLTRIYPVSRLERVWSGAKSLVRSTFLPSMSPAPGFIPEAFVESERTSFTRARTKAVDTISFRIEAGLFGLLGPNGAGKTTLLRMIAGIDQPTRGYLSICGYDMKTESKKAQKLIGYLPQYFGVYSHMSAYNYLEYFALLKGMRNKKERHEAILHALEMVNLLEQQSVPVGNFSGGMKRRVGLAQILIQPPKVLLVDEPTVGLDPMERLRFRNMLVRLSQDRVVILSTHIVEDVAHSCREMAVMDEGKVFYTGSPDRMVESVRDRVWELTVANESAWHELRRLYTVVGQSYTTEGIRIRILSDEPPSPNAHCVEPTLEDAYLYYTRLPKKA